MGIYIHSRSLCLLEQLLHVFQIVTRDKYSRVLSYTYVYFRNLRISVCFSICGIEKSHYVNTEFSCFKSQGYKLVSAQCVIQRRGQSLAYETVNIFVFFSQIECMLGICGNSLESVCYKFSKRTDILIFCCKNSNLHRISLCLHCGGCICEPSGSIMHVIQ